MPELTFASVAEHHALLARPDGRHSPQVSLILLPYIVSPCFAIHFVLTARLLAPEKARVLPYGRKSAESSPKVPRKRRAARPIPPLALTSETLTSFA